MHCKEREVPSVPSLKEGETTNIGIDTRCCQTQLIDNLLFHWEDHPKNDKLLLATLLHKILKLQNTIIKQ